MISRRRQQPSKEKTEAQKEAAAAKQKAEEAQKELGREKHARKVLDLLLEAEQRLEEKRRDERPGLALESKIGRLEEHGQRETTRPYLEPGFRGGVISLKLLKGNLRGSPLRAPLRAARLVSPPRRSTRTPGTEAATPPAVRTPATSGGTPPAPRSAARPSWR